MKNINIYFLIIILLPVFQSCEKQTEFNFEYPDSKLVVNYLVNPDSIKLYLSRSLTPTDIINFKEVRDAKIELFQNDLSTGFLNNFVETDKNHGLGYYTNANINLYPNDSIKIIVSHSDYENLYASTYIPPKPEYSIQVKEFVLESVPLTDGYIYNALVEILIEKRNNSDNYFIVKPYYKAEFYDYPQVNDTLYFENMDFEINSENVLRSYKLNDGYLIDQSNSNNSAEAYLLNINHFLKLKNTDNRKIYIEVKSISKDYFLYQKTLKEYYLAAQNPFAELLKVYGNINGGFGIFAGYNSTIDSVLVQPAR